MAPLTRLERAELRIAEAKASFVADDIDLERFEETVENEYRMALRLPKTMEQLAEEFYARHAREEGTVVNGETRSERTARLCREGRPIAAYPGRPEYDGLSLDEISRAQT